MDGDQDQNKEQETENEGDTDEDERERKGEIRTGDGPSATQHQVVSQKVGRLLNRSKWSTDL